MKISRLVLLLTVLQLFLGLPGALALGDGAAVRVGNMAPDFTLSDLSGKTVTLSQLRGKVVFLNFWATWCPPCRTEMPSMEMLNEVFSSSDFVMLAVNVEREGDKTVPSFLERNPHSFSILLDLDEKVQRSYGVFRFPETFLIDSEGRVARHFIGAYDWSEVQILKQVKELMDK